MVQTQNMDLETILNERDFSRKKYASVFFIDGAIACSHRMLHVLWRSDYCVIRELPEEEAVGTVLCRNGDIRILGVISEFWLGLTET